MVIAYTGPPTVTLSQVFWGSNLHGPPASDRSARPPAGLPVNPRVGTAATRESTPADDHPGRVRIATTPYLPSPPRRRERVRRSGRRTSAPATPGSGTRRPPRELAALSAPGVIREPDGR
jgi:hypothetical protein